MRAPDALVERLLIALGIHASRTRLHATQLMKFALTGGCNALLDLLLLTAFVELARLPVPLAVGFADFITVTSAFLINKHWTFRNFDRRHIRQYVQFWLVYGSSIGIAVAVTWFLADVLGIHYLPARLLAIPVHALWNYGWLHCRVFRPRAGILPLVLLLMTPAAVDAETAPVAADTVVEARIAEGENGNRHTFVGAPGQIVTIGAYFGHDRGHGIGTSGELRLLGPDGTVLALPAQERQYFRHCSGFCMDAERIYADLRSASLPADGTFFLEVSGERGAHRGAYWLRSSAPSTRMTCR